MSAISIGIRRGPCLAPDPHRRAAEILLSRQSVSSLQEPAPDDADLALILEAGLRAPRITAACAPGVSVLIRGAARAAPSSEVLIQACGSASPIRPRPWSTASASNSSRVPLLIAIGTKIDPDGHIPEDRAASLCGCGCRLNMLNAIHALGCGIWVTGANVYDRRIYNQALDSAWPDRLAGFLFVGGTPRCAAAGTPAAAGRSHERMDGRGAGQRADGRAHSTPCQDIRPDRKSS